MQAAGMHRIAIMLSGNVFPHRRHAFSAIQAVQNASSGSDRHVTSACETEVSANTGTAVHGTMLRQLLVVTVLLLGLLAHAAGGSFLPRYGSSTFQPHEQASTVHLPRGSLAVQRRAGLSVDLAESQCERLFTICWCAVRRHDACSVSYGLMRTAMGVGLGVQCVQRNERVNVLPCSFSCSKQYLMATMGCIYSRFVRLRIHLPSSCVSYPWLSSPRCRLDGHGCSWLVVRLVLHQHCASFLLRCMDGRAVQPAGDGHGTVSNARLTECRRKRD